MATGFKADISHRGSRNQTQATKHQTICHKEAQSSEGDCSSQGAYGRTVDSRRPDGRFSCLFVAIKIVADVNDVVQ
jgi:hypothetical protein